MKFAAAAVAVLLATPALAQDADWTGFYAGAGLTSMKSVADGDSEDFSGVTVAAGYLKDAGSFVYGGEIGYQVDTARRTEFDAEITSTALKAILGYDLGKTLVFASAGSVESKISAGGGDFEVSDNLGFVGIGARHVFMEKYVAGIEFIRAQKENFGGLGFGDLNNDIVSIRLDYRF